MNKKQLALAISKGIARQAATYAASSALSASTNPAAAAALLGGAWKVGSAVIPPVARALGRGARAVYRRSRGSKLQKVQFQPLAQNRRMGPSFSRQPFVVSHREMIREIVGSSNTYDNTAINIQPGFVQVFPWLSRLAGNYETYRFRRFKVHYVPRCPATEKGLVVISPDYDVIDSPPTTVADALNTKDAQSGNVWGELTVDLDMAACHRVTTFKKVRDNYGENAGNADDLFDTAIVNLGLAGTTAGDALGDLWMDYEVEFYTPQTSKDKDRYPQHCVWAEADVLPVVVPPADFVPFPTPVNDSLHTGGWVGGSLVLPLGNFRVVFDLEFVPDSAADMVTLVVLYAGVPLVTSQTLGGSVGTTGHVHIERLIHSDGASKLQVVNAGVNPETIQPSSAAYIFAV